MRQILESINKEGLTTAKPFSVRGALKDPKVQGPFCHNQINLTKLNPSERKQAYASLVYHEKEGLWAIAMERHFQTTTTLELSTGLMNSVAFIFELSSLAVNNKTTHCRPMYDQRMFQQHDEEENTIFFEEVRRMTDNNYQGIARNTFRAILAPNHLVTMVQSIFKNLHVIPCNAIEETIQVEPLELFAIRKSAVGTTIIGPNYLRGLELFTLALPSINKIGIHLTRLPMTPIEQFCQQSPREFYNKSYWRTSRITNLKLQQMYLLRRHADIFIFVESDNSAMVIYQPHRKATVETIANNYDRIIRAAETIQQFYRGHLNRKVTLFFRERRHFIESKKTEMTTLIKNNQFTDCTKEIAKTINFEQETQTYKTEFQELGAAKFLKQRKMK